MKNLAIYMRISQEDDKELESESIQNQRDFLHNFIASKAEFADYNIVEIIDDGMSGTTLERKGLQKLLQRAGKDIFLILVKDFSRFARNLIEVGNYLDSVFPFLGVRFISVNDGYDSAENMGKTIGLDMSLKAMVYDMYSKDLSAKVCSTKKIQMQKGQHIGRTAIFGYRKNENNRKTIVVDEMSAQVVRQIFNLRIEGKTLGEIARILNNEGVLSPQLYREKFLPNEPVTGLKKSNNLKWTGNIIDNILKDERYIGTYIARKQKRESLSSKKRINVPKEEWIRIENSFEPIVSKEVFELVASMTRKYTKNNQLVQINSLFASILTCNHCNRNLTKQNSKNAYYFCPTKKFDDKSSCKSIKVMEKDLEQAVLTALNTQIKLMDSNKSVLNSITKKDTIEKSIKECDKELKSLSKKSIYLFEQFADEKISTEDYKTKKSINDKAITNAKENLQSLHEELQILMTQNENSNSLSKYKYIDKLTRDMVLELVREIKVYEDNRIEIVWNFKEN